MPQRQKTASRTKNTSTKNTNEGEGSRTAARRYSAGVTRTVQSGRVPGAARRAAKALDSKEGPELRRAETRARKRRPSV